MGARGCAVEGMAVNREFWQGRSVFLTGHTGFKGSWLSLWLQMLGAEVTGFALPPSTVPNLFELANVAGGMKSILGDIRDAISLNEAVSAAKPEIVIHMAAQPLVLASYADPIETYSTNVMGTVHLLEAVRHSDTVRAVVNVTTDKCYENREWVWGYRETDPMGGYDPYSSSKGCAELVSAAYRRSFFSNDKCEGGNVALATARAGNVIGGGDFSPNRLIPDVIAALGKNENPIIRSPRSIRPWQHVMEPLRGYLMLAEKLCSEGQSFADAWNFGPEPFDAQPVSWVVEALISRFNRELEWSNPAPGLHHEANFLKLDISKARSELGWHPVIDLPVALDFVAEWTRRCDSGDNPRQVILDQIHQYEQLASA